jgi:hypothetical protein
VEEPVKGNGYNMYDYRGSAGPVPWTSSSFPEEDAIGVMHKVHVGDQGRRYYHRFMTFTKDKKPSRVSCYVRMTKERVEYWSGMCPSIDGNSYHICYGLKDSEGYVSELSKESIEALLFHSLHGNSVPSTTRFSVLKQY